MPMATKREILMHSSLKCILTGLLDLQLVAGRTKSQKCARL